MITITRTPSDTAYKIIPCGFELDWSRTLVEYFAHSDGESLQDVADAFLGCYVGDEVVEFDIYGCDGYNEGSFCGLPGQIAHHI